MDTEDLLIGIGGDREKDRFGFDPIVEPPRGEEHVMSWQVHREGGFTICDGGDNDHVGEIECRFIARAIPDRIRYGSTREDVAKADDWARANAKRIAMLPRAIDLLRPYGYGEDAITDLLREWDALEVRDA